MNILYKYCNCLGGLKILASLELKLPFISDVNDPHECRPYYYCGNDEDKIKGRCLKAFGNMNKLPPENFRQQASDLIKKGNIQERLIASTQEVQNECYKENCLLSASKNAKSPVMWAHYADMHQGVVIGIDFDTLFCEKEKIGGIKMHEVKYLSERQQIDVLDDTERVYFHVLITKSSVWKHEEEFRSVLARKSPNVHDTTLENLERKGLASFKYFNGKKTWFLRLNPSSIKQIIFGLYAEESLKLAVKKLVVGLQNVKLYQASESKTYDFDLIELTL